MRRPHTGMADIARDAGISDDMLAALREAGRPFDRRPFQASTPSFKAFDSDELGNCGTSQAFPAFSITGPVCALNCKHCRAEILKPMIPAGGPDRFDALVRGMIARQGLRGFLLSGGSSARNEVPFERYLPVIARLKADFPALTVLAHTGLVDARRARALKAAGVDVAMLDIIGDAATIRDIYHLGRGVDDFEDSLAHLVAAGLNVVPHVVIGLHYGRILGEGRALEIISRHVTAAAILVVLMPAFAAPGFAAVDLSETMAVFTHARRSLADRKLLLGCARPHGSARTALDVAAVLAGFDGVAYPADDAVRMARLIGRPFHHRHACCGADACARAA